jgi:hypothetical protein
MARQGKCKAKYKVRQVQGEGVVSKGEASISQGKYKTRHVQHKYKVGTRQGQYKGRQV